MSAPDTSPGKLISRNISLRWRGVAVVWAVIYFTLATGLASYAYRYPDNAWDMLGYMGVIASWRTTDASSIHEEAYSAIRSKPKYAALVGNDATSEIHRDVAHDSVHFVQQLPFYSIKPLYCIAAAGLHRAGFSLPGSLLLISLFSFICYALVAWVWLRKYIGQPWCTIFSGLLILTPPLFHLGRIGTPDALELLLLVSGLYLLLEHSKAGAGCTLFLVAIWVRPDAIVFVGLLFCVLFFLQIIDVTEWVTFCALALISYGLIQVCARPYPWGVLFQNSFIGILPAPGDAVVHITPRIYASITARNAWALVKSFSITSMFFIALIAILLHGRRPYRLITATVLTAAIIHFLLYPSTEIRFYALPTFFVPLSLLLACSAYLFKRPDDFITGNSSHP